MAISAGKYIPIMYTMAILVRKYIHLTHTLAISASKYIHLIYTMAISAGEYTCNVWSWFQRFLVRYVLQAIPLDLCNAGLFQHVCTWRGCWLIEVATLHWKWTLQNGQWLPVLLTSFFLQL